METKLFELFRKTFEAHILLKGVCPLFHEKSQDFYELLFECDHQIREKRQDIESEKPGDESKLIKETYDNIEMAKTLIADMIDENESIGMDNLLRGLYDKLEFACGNARGFIKEEKEKEDKEEEEIPQKKPVERTKIDIIKPR